VEVGIGTPSRSSKLDAIEAAFAKLGKQLEVSIS